MRILLVDPPFQRFIGYYRFYFPLGLTYLAAVLRKAGHDVLIYDGDHDPNGYSPSLQTTASMHYLYLEALRDDYNPIWLEYSHLLNDFQPDAVGISFLTPKVASALKIALLTKQISPNCTVIAGGEHVTSRPQDALGKNVDYVVCGEGEQGLALLIQQLADGQQPQQIIRSRLIETLDLIPLPALDCLHAKTYRPTDMGLMITARGCPFPCRFCALRVIWGRRVRYHSINRVLSEITLRKEQYGTEYFSFRNGTFTLNQKRVAEFCLQLLRCGPRILWECLTRVGHFDEALLTAMQKAGCVQIRIGIESGSQRVLNSMAKNITLDQIRESVRLLRSSGIMWSAYFMLGIPAETEESINETLDLIQEIDPPFVTLARFSPLPGTPMYQEVVDAGLLDEHNTDWTWAANQSLDRSFVRDMPEGRFLELMHHAASVVEKHNAKRAQSLVDARLKSRLPNG